MPPILQAENFDVGYGEVAVVRAVSFSLQAGEVVALLGRNGMGKTTLLRGIMGLAPLRRGMLAFLGSDIGFAEVETIARLGAGYVPAERGIFGSLTVKENLLMCARPDADGATPWTLERTLALFPRLAE